MLGEVGNIGKIPELRKRILFTIAMLAVYRLGVFVSTPGIDVAALRRMFDSTGDGTLYGLINLFSGGALEHFSIFTLGITPYISVSIIMQFVGPVFKTLEDLKKQGEVGRRIITRYTRIGTILLALIQGFFIARGIESQGLARDPGFLFRLCTMLTLTTGTAFIMWLGEQITEKGIGNGASLIICTGIIARMPHVLFATLGLARTGEVAGGAVLLMIAFAVLTVGIIVYVERAQRKIPIQYPRRSVGRGGVTQAQTQYMPFKVNMSGVIPPIFASALIVVPLTIAQFASASWAQNINLFLRHGSIIYSLIFGLLVLICSYFATGIMFNPEEMADNLKKNGGFVPTVRPGKPTAEYLYSVLNNLTLWGAIYIVIICLVPEYMFVNLGAPEFSRVFGGTAILIVVGVTMDTASQIQSFILARNYEAFMSSSAKGGMASTGYMRSRLVRR